MIHDGHQTQPSLLGGGDDLIGWQDEAKTTSIPQLEGVGVLDALVVSPVNGATAGLVDGGDDAAVSVASTVQGGKVSGSPPGQTAQLDLVPGWSSSVAERVQEQLGVGMDGNKGLDVAIGFHKVHNGLDLRLRVSPGSTVDV